MLNIRRAAALAAATILSGGFAIATRVRSSSMQSVYISAAMALWAFAVVIWAVERFG